MIDCEIQKRRFAYGILVPRRVGPSCCSLFVVIKVMPVMLLNNTILFWYFDCQLSYQCFNDHPIGLHPWGLLFLAILANLLSGILITCSFNCHRIFLHIWPYHKPYTFLLFLSYASYLIVCVVWSFSVFSFLLFVTLLSDLVSAPYVTIVRMRVLYSLFLQSIFRGLCAQIVSVRWKYIGIGVGA